MARTKAENTAKVDYPVEIIEDAFGESPAFTSVLQKVTGEEKPRVFIVADTNVVQRTEGLGSKIGRYLNAHGIALAASPVVLAGNEKIKADGLHSAALIISSLLGANLRKSDCVLVIGGGTMLDVACYAAGQVRGGLNVVRMPTTPAAMMDAAFADYGGVDSKHVKDALRVRSVPSAVVVDCTFATSVMDGVWRSGYGAAVRQAIVSDPAFFKTLVKNANAYHKRDFDVFREVVAGTVAARQKKGGTKLGVWAAHRLESTSGYKVPHGHAITVGMILDVCYAAETGLLKDADRDTFFTVLRESKAIDGFTHSRHQLSAEDAILEGLGDWANLEVGGGLTLPAGLGKKTVVTAPDPAVYRKIIKDILSTPAKA